MRTETVTYFVTGDGQRFTDAAAAARHEVLVAEVAEIMAPLGDVPKDVGCNFANGHGYIPHAPADIAAIRRALCEIGKRDCKCRFDHWDAVADGTCHLSYACRILDDCGPSALSKAFLRLFRCDPDGREWGQPYFALNPTEGDQVVWQGAVAVPS